CDGQAETGLDARTGYAAPSRNQPEPHAGNRAHRLLARVHRGSLPEFAAGSHFGRHWGEPAARKVRPVALAAPRPYGTGSPDCVGESFQPDAGPCAGARAGVRRAAGSRGRPRPADSPDAYRGPAAGAVGAAFGLALASVLSRVILRFLDTGGNRLSLD